LKEPRPNEQECIPWIGETLIKERLLRLCARGKIAINLRGVEYLQAQPGEDADAAWNRMKGRLGSGRHLDETYLLFPQAVPQAYGVGATSGTDIAPPIGTDLFGGGSPSGPSSTGGGGYNPEQTSTPLPLFGGDRQSTYQPLYSPPTSALNLMGKVESWGVGPGSEVRDLSLKIESLSGAQLQKLLKGLPDGLSYELSCQKEEN
jgi:hypothetical protein